MFTLSKSIARKKRLSLFALMLLCSFSLLMITACKSGSDETTVTNGADPAGDKPAGQGGDTSIDMTNYIPCQSGVETNLFQTWYRRTKISETLDQFVDAKLVINKQTIEVHKKCSYQGQSMDLMVTLPIQVNGRVISITTGGGQSGSFEVGSTKVDCSLKVNSGDMQFVFQGKCVRLSDQSGNTKVWSSAE